MPKLLLPFKWMLVSLNSLKTQTGLFGQVQLLVGGRLFGGIVQQC